MAKFIISFLVLFCSVAYGQTDTTKFYGSNDYGWYWQRGQFKRVLMAPADTSNNKNGVVRIGTVLYAGNGSYWSPQTIVNNVVSRGYIKSDYYHVGSDTLGFILTRSDNREDTILFKSAISAANIDTANLSYRIDTTSKILTAGFGVSISKIDDSTYIFAADTARITGVPTYHYVDSMAAAGGGSGSQDLASVTAIGATTTDSITFLNSGDRLLNLGTTEAGGPYYQGAIEIRTGYPFTKHLYRKLTHLYDYIIDGKTGIIPRKIGWNPDLYGFSDLVYPSTDNSSRYLALSVNGNYADTLGNITVSTAGVDTTSLSNRINAKADIASPTFTGTVTAPALTLTSTTTAFLPNRVTTTQMNAISSPVDGMQVYNTDEGINFTYSTAWGWESSAMSWRRKYGVEYFNDFLGITTGTIHDGNLLIYTSSGTVSSSTSPLTNRQGIITLSTSTSATGRAGIGTSTGATNQTMILGGGKILFETAVYIPTLSSPTERFQFMAGFSTTNNSTTISNGVLFVYDSAGVSTGGAASPNWQVMTARASTRSWTTTSTAVTAATWYTLRAEINAAGSEVLFYINNTLVKTETTNIPTAAVGMMHQIYKTVGTTARTADIDYIYFKQKYTTAR